MSSLLESVSTYGWFGEDLTGLESMATYGWYLDFDVSVATKGIFVEMDGIFEEGIWF